jgi:hypothetical protein
VGLVVRHELYSKNNVSVREVANLPAIAGYEAIHMIRKGQAYGSAAGAKVGLLHRFIVSMFGIKA